MDLNSSASFRLIWSSKAPAFSLRMNFDVRSMSNDPEIVSYVLAIATCVQSATIEFPTFYTKHEAILNGVPTTLDTGQLLCSRATKIDPSKKFT